MGHYYCVGMNFQAPNVLINELAIGKYQRIYLQYKNSQWLENIRICDIENLSLITLNWANIEIIFHLWNSSSKNIDF